MSPDAIEARAKEMYEEFMFDHVYNEADDPGFVAHRWEETPDREWWLERARTEEMFTDLADTLYHGTSDARWAAIQRDGKLKLPDCGDRKISLTEKKEVALYWAELSAGCDLQEGRGDGVGVVLSFDTETLRRAGYEFEAFSDDVWGEGNAIGRKSWRAGPRSSWMTLSRFRIM